MLYSYLFTCAFIVFLNKLSFMKAEIPLDFFLLYQKLPCTTLSKSTWTWGATLCGIFQTDLILDLFIMAHFADYFQVGFPVYSFSSHNCPQMLTCMNCIDNLPFLPLCFWLGSVNQKQCYTVQKEGE